MAGVPKGRQPNEIADVLAGLEGMVGIWTGDFIPGKMRPSRWDSDGYGTWKVLATISKSVAL